MGSRSKVLPHVDVAGGAAGWNISWRLQIWWYPYLNKDISNIYMYVYIYILYIYIYTQIIHIHIYICIYIYIMFQHVSLKQPIVFPCSHLFSHAMRGPPGPPGRRRSGDEDPGQCSPGCWGQGFFAGDPGKRPRKSTWLWPSGNLT